MESRSQAVNQLDCKTSHRLYKLKFTIRRKPEEFEGIFVEFAMDLANPKL